MSKLLVGFVSLALVLGTGTARAGDKDKVITVDKTMEIKGQVKTDDPKVNLKGLELPAKQFPMKLEGGKTYRITMDTSDDGFDPFLIIQDKDGKMLAFDDDSGGKLNSLINFAPKENGVYKVFAASLTGEAGTFTLKVVPSGGGKEKEKGKTLKVGADGVRLTDSLKEGALRLPFEIEFEADKTYTIDLSSKAFDAFLILEKDGKQLAENDDAVGLDSQIIFRAPAAGTYRIVATSFGGAGTGEFVLQVRQK